MIEIYLIGIVGFTIYFILDHKEIYQYLKPSTKNFIQRYPFFFTASLLFWAVLWPIYITIGIVTLIKVFL